MSSLLIARPWCGDGQCRALVCSQMCPAVCQERGRGAALSPHGCLMLGLNKLTSSTHGPRFGSRKLNVLKCHDLVTKARCVQGQNLHPLDDERRLGLSC